LNEQQLAAVTGPPACFQILDFFQHQASSV
jgi:hypothetical protein